MSKPFRARIAEASKNKKSVIVLALDPSPGRPAPKEFAIKTVSAVHEHVCAIKLNFHLLLPLAASEISEINALAHSRGLQSIADIKLNDIEHTNEVALDSLIRIGFDAVIANPFMGAGALASLVKQAHKMNAGVIALVYMSHPEAKEGYGLEVAGKRAMYEIFLERAAQADADGIVVGATRVEILKQIARRKKMPVYSPGVGAQGGDVEQAVRNGADYLIVGRSIVEAKEPANVAKEIQDTILSVSK